MYIFHTLDISHPNGVDRAEKMSTISVQGRYNKLSFRFFEFTLLHTRQAVLVASSLIHISQRRLEYVAYIIIILITHYSIAGGNGIYSLYSYMHCIIKGKLNICLRSSLSISSMRLID